MKIRFDRCLPVVLVLTLMMGLVAKAEGYDGPQDQRQSTAASVGVANGPAFTEYRGIRIGMAASEVRQKLGRPRLKDKSQDLFEFDENETAQVFYDAQEKVYAISIDYTGKTNGAPTAKEVLNEEVNAKADGSIYRMKQYSDAGFWVSYNRTSSDPPQITITMQKITH